MERYHRSYRPWMSIGTPTNWDGPGRNTTLFANNVSLMLRLSTLRFIELGDEEVLSTSCPINQTD